MEGESAVQAVHGPALEAREAEEAAAARPTSRESIDEMRADYEHQLDARYAGARGFIDAIVYPEDTRDVLAHGAPRRRCRIPGRTSAPFVLPPHLDDA